MHRTLIVAALFAAAALVACKNEKPSSSERTATGGGPRNDTKVPEVHYSSAPADIERGKELFAEKGCNGCHYVGGGVHTAPDLKGVTARRDKQWLATLIVRPDLLLKDDPTVKEQLATHTTKMVNQNISDRELDMMMSYLKANE